MRTSSRRRFTHARVLHLTLTVVALLSCNDSSNPVAPPSDPTLAHVRCVVAMPNGGFVCTSPTSGAERAAFDGVIVGAQGTLVNLAASGASYDAAASVLRANITVQNLIGQAIGTTNGTTADAKGVRVFFTARPTTTGGRGSVTVRNADGTDTFTAANQQYFQYSQILPPSATSNAREWQFAVPSGVTSFQFDVLVAAAVEHPDGFVTVTPPAAVLHAGATLPLTAAVRNVLGAAVANEAVVWTTSNGSVATVSAAGQIGAVTAGTATITATAGIRTGTAAITVIAPSATTSTLAATPLSLLAGQTSAITVQAKDAAGQNLPMGGDVVTVASTRGTVSAITDAGDGTYRATLSSTTAGTAVLSATLNGTAIPGTVTVTFTAAAATTMVKNSTDPQTASAGTAVAVAPSVLVRDQFGNPVSGAAVTFAVASGGGNVTGATQSTNAAGIATIGSWTLGTTAGANTLTATSGGLSVTFSATGTAGAASVMTKVAGDAQTATASTAVPIAPSVLVKDANGNVVSGASVVFTPAAGSGSVTGGTQTTNAAGVATVGSWTLGNVAGTNTLSVTSGAASVTFTATGTIGDPAVITAVAGTGQSAAAGGTVTIPPAVLVTDIGGNPIAGAPVTFAVTAGGGSVTGPAQVTNASGIATVGSWTLGTVVGTNNNTLTASAAGLSAGITASVTAGPLHHFLIEATGGGAIGAQTAGTPFSVRITAQDIANNTVTSFAGTVNVTSNRAGTAGLTTSAAFSAGVLAGHSVTLSVAGAGATLTATRTGGAEAGTSNAFTINPGALHHFLVEAFGGGVIATQTAGTPFNIRVTAQDVANNTVTSFTGTADITSNRAGSSGLTTTAALTAGVLASHSVTLTQSGAASTLTATRTGGTETGTSAAFAVNAGAVTHFLVEATGGGAIAAQTAGAPFGVRVTALDASNNTATSFMGTVDVTSNVTGSAGLSTSAAFTAGVLANHSVTLTQSSANATITATRTGGAETGTSNAFAIGAGAVTHFLVEAAGGGAITTQTAATPFSVRITAQDATNNTVTGFTGTVDVTSNRTGSAGLTTTAAFTAGVLATHSVTLTQSGTLSTITATRTGGAEAGTSNTFTVNAGALHHFLVEAAGGGAIAAQIAGTPFSVRVTAQDVNNNTATTFTGTVDVTSNRTGSAGLVTSAAFTAGVLASHSVTLTLSGAGATITATRTGGTETGTSVGFTVNPAALNHFLVEAAGGGAIGAQTAGTPFSVQVTAQDASNNTVTGFAGTVDVTSNRTGSAGLVTTAAFTAGVLTTHSITLSQSGANSTITATRTGGAEAGTSATFTVNPGALAHFLVEAQGGGSVGTQGPNIPFNIRVTAQDAGNNTVTAFTGTVDITSTGTLTAGSGATAAFTAGVLASHSVTIGNSGTFTITATRTGGAEAGTSNSFVLLPPPSVVNTTPLNGANGIAVGAPIVVTFSTVVNATTSSFVIKCPAGGAALPFTLSASPAPTFTLTPVSPLPGGEVCQVTVVAAQVTDGGAVPMTADFIFSFATQINAINDTYPFNVTGNVSTNSTLAGFSATTNDGVGASATIAFAGWIATPGVTENGGTVSMTTSGIGIGQFTYDPPAGFTGTDHFTYTVTSGLTSASATVSLPVSGVIWFVDNTTSCAANCDGRLSHPFTTLAALQAVNDGIGRHPAPGQPIFLAEGGPAYAGPVTLLNNQKLIGQDATRSLSALTGLTPQTGSAPLPTMTPGNGAFAVIGGAAGGVSLASGANAFLHGLTIATTGGAALSGANFGTLALADGSVEPADVTINNSGGEGVSLFSGTVSGVLASVTSSGGFNNINIILVETVGTVNLGTGALSGASDKALVIAGGAGSFTYAGTISNTNVFAVDVHDKGGGTVTLSGNINPAAPGRGISIATNIGSAIVLSGTVKQINSGTSFGVNISSNTGSTVSLTNGGLTVATTTGLGVTINGGATVAITGAGNTINTSAGVGLQVSGSTIAATGLTFQSISAAGAANGIFMLNTGALGGLTVTGAGGSCSRSTATCTGGTIGNTNGADGAVGGNGVFLSNTANVSLTRMRINGTHQNFGLYGTNVTGLTLSNVLMDGTYGTNAAVNEGTMAFDELKGSATISNSYFAGGIKNNVRIHNASAATTLNRVTFTADTIGFTNTGAASNSGLQVLVDAGTTNVTVQNSSFLGAGQYNTEFVVIGGGADLVFNNNLLVDGQSNTSATFTHLTLVADGTNASTGTITYAIGSNNFTGSKQAAIYIPKRHGQWLLNGSITGNTIGTAGTANSGSFSGEGIRVEHTSEGKHKLLIDNNQVFQYNNIGGITMRFVSNTTGAPSNGSMHLTLTRNTVSNPGTNNPGSVIDGVHFLPAGTTGDTYTMCVNFGRTGGANTIVNGGRVAEGGAPYSIGPVTPPNVLGFFKLLGLAGGPFTGNVAETPLDMRISADNGFPSTLGFIDLGSAITTTASTNNGVGVTCDLP